MTDLGDMFRKARSELGWTPQECARHAGYENADKGANRLLAIERGRDRFPDERVWGRFAKALDIAPTAVEEALQAEFDRLDSIQREPMLMAKPFAGFYYRHEVPPSIDDADLIEFAKSVAREHGFQTCVVYSPVRCVYVEPDGTTFESVHSPFMRFR